MKKIVTASLVAAMALSSLDAASNAQLEAKLNAMETEIAELKAQLKKDTKKMKKKISEVKAHDANDNIKWGADVRTAMDSIIYDMANETTKENKDLLTLRLWLNMEYAPDQRNIFKGQLSMNKAFGADFGDMSSNRAFSMGTLFDWTGNAALGDNALRVRQAYWLYLGDGWTFSVGRRPSGTGFLTHLREDDAPLSPLGHIINVEFDGASSKFDLGNATGIPGMSFKICVGRGSTNATPMFGSMDGAQYAEDEDQLEDINLAGFIFEPYNDGQFIVKTTAFRAFDLPGYDGTEYGAAMGGAEGLGGPIDNDFLRGSYTYDLDGNPIAYNPAMSQLGDIDGAAISVLVDGLGDSDFLFGTKLFASYAVSRTDPKSGQQMLGSSDSEVGHSYYAGVQLPVAGGKLGFEYNHGSEYWRPFTYGEDTMIGSKLAARGDAFEAYYTYQLTQALSFQARYTMIDYEYTGSNGFFGMEGTPMKIDDIKMAAAMGDPMATQMLPMIVEKAQDFRVYLRYRF